MTSPTQYLESHHISFYMEDCITQLLLYREDNPKVNPRNFIADYFKCLNSGNHVLLREFAFVSATPHNRLSFVRLIYRAYCNLNEVGNCLSLQELHSLLLLLCPDLPWRLVEVAGLTAHETVLVSSAEGAAGPGQASSSPDSLKQARFLFSDFLMAFQIHLLYDEFLEKSAQLYESLLSGRSSNIDVFLPQTDQQQQQQQTEGSTPGAAVAMADQLQRVSSSAFSRLVEGACHELQLHVPNMDIIKKSFGSNRTTTYREFVGGLVRNKELSAALVSESNVPVQTVFATGMSASIWTLDFGQWKADQSGMSEKESDEVNEIGLISDGTHELSYSAHNWPTVAPGSTVHPMTSQLVPAAAATSAVSAVSHSQSSAAAVFSQTASSAASGGQQRQKRLIAGAPTKLAGGMQKSTQRPQQHPSKAGNRQQATGSSSGSSSLTGSSGAGSTDTDSDSV